MNKRLGNIEFSDNEISEYDRKQKVVIVPRKKIKAISLELGFVEESPIKSIIIGIVTSAFGIIFGILPIRHILLSSLNGEHVHGSWGFFVIAIPLIYIGGCFILKIFRYSYFLKVSTPEKTRKMGFGKSFEKGVIKSFIKECNITFGCNIRLNI